MNPFLECCAQRREIGLSADRIRPAASSPVREDEVMLKNRSLAERTACFSSWL